MFGGYLCDDYDTFRRDRYSWAQKSQAALRREKEAIDLFDAFLQTCENLTNFPVTEEIVPATPHLTNPCWQTFRKHVESKGCHAKRREATLPERGNDHRKGKMYVISVTVPAHPSNSVQVEKERKGKAEEEAAKRKEKAALAAAKKKAEEERLEKIRKDKEEVHQARVQQTYWGILGMARVPAGGEPAAAQDDQKPPAVPSAIVSQSKKNTADGQHKDEDGDTFYNTRQNGGPDLPSNSISSVNRASVSQPAAGPPPTPSSSQAAAAAPSTTTEEEAVSSMDLLQYNDKTYKDIMKKIHMDILKEEQQLKQKKRTIEDQATKEYKRAKQIIMSAAPVSSKKCLLCKKSDFKVPAAQCVTKECKSVVCSTCLSSKKISDDHQCVVCREKSKKGVSTIIQNIKCPECIDKLDKGDYFQFEYCRNDCGFICQQHTHEQDCCVCGFSSYCTTCQVGSCDRCGNKLCSRCSYKEGCMCEGKSRRQILMEELGEYDEY